MTRTRGEDAVAPTDPPDTTRAPLSERVRLLRGVPTTIAVATVLLGVVDIVSALAPERAGRLHDLTTVIPLGVAQSASAVTLVAGILLVLLGQGLRRRKRRAWRGALALTAATMVLHLVKGLDIEEASVTLVLTVLLVVLSDQFYAAGDPRTRRRAPVTFVAMVLASFVLGYLLLLFRHSSIVGSPSVGARFSEVAAGLVGVGGPLH
jgi:lysyl-tRNA synthetase class 2